MYQNSSNQGIAAMTNGNQIAFETIDMDQLASVAGGFDPEQIAHGLKEFVGGVKLAWHGAQQTWHGIFG